MKLLVLTQRLKMRRRYLDLNREISIFSCYYIHWLGNCLLLLRERGKQIKLKKIASLPLSLCLFFDGKKCKVAKKQKNLQNCIIVLGYLIEEFH